MALPNNRGDREYQSFRDTGVSDKTRIATALEGAFQAPQETDALTVDYPSSTVEVYKFRQGGASGTVLMTLTVTYTNASKNFTSSVVRT